ncbi:hypothetical protein SAMN05216463_10213 [Xylanibacter ruminicola]|uniref:Uncharacterized protein n=2 Tax=Xylanibacter ruminicola TaxID=839 RepID=A0A1M6RLP7_XYLRU|nr:hypothetical protein SAMN05216463_10213 [Xylanibacter ruminicola]
MRGACCASQEVTLAIEQFLMENYHFRRNTLNGKVEFVLRCGSSKSCMRGKHEGFMRD